MILAPSDFLGRWSIERIIQEARSVEPARFKGVATITETETFWEFSETGELSLPTGAKMHAERKYLWKPNGSGFDVYFDDERFFHRFELGVQAQASHWCDPDQYDVAYDFNAWPKWTSTWNVSGPRKDYVMKSDHQKLT